MVAVTVILAAVIGAFVLGFGDSLSDPAPNAQIDFDYSASADTLNVTHDGGVALTSENTGFLTLNGVNTTGTYTWLDGSGAGTTDEDEYTMGDDDQISAGNSIVDVDLVDDTDTDEVSLVWENSDRSNSQELGSYTVP